MLICSVSVLQFMLSECTAGAKIVGDRYYLLKNRDLIWGGFRDTIVFENDVFFVTGVNVNEGGLIGASFGFNRYGLAACNTTVLANESTPDDILLEKILRETKTIEDALELIQKDLESGNSYQWCNFILASPEGVGAIEIGDGVVVLEQDTAVIVRTNHHLLLPTTDIIKRIAQGLAGVEYRLPGSQKRRQDATKHLAESKSMMDMTQLLCTHSESRGVDSICRHLPEDARSNPYHGETVYSYVAEVSELEGEKMEFRLKVTPGNPCVGTFKEFVVDFDSPESKYNILTNYP